MDPWSNVRQQSFKWVMRMNFDSDVEYETGDSREIHIAIGVRTGGGGGGDGGDDGADIGDDDGADVGGDDDGAVDKQERAEGDTLRP